MGKTTAATTYVAATREGEYPGGAVWLCGETLNALELSMQQVHGQYLAGPHDGTLPRDDACDAFLQWLAKGGRGRWLVVIDNVDGVEEVLPRFMDKMPPSAVGDVLVTTRASRARVRSEVSWAAFVEQRCLRTSDAAVVVWRLVGAYNAEHKTRCGWKPAAHSAQAPVDSSQAGVPNEVPQELRQLWLESRSEYTALVALARDSERGFGGLPLALVVGSGALCIRGESFSSFLAACEGEMLARLIRTNSNEVVGKPPPSATKLLQRCKIGSARAAAIVAALNDGGPVTLSDLSDLDEDTVHSVSTTLLERQKLRRAVKAAREKGAKADDEAVERSQARQRLAGLWALSRAGLSAAAQEFMEVIAYYPADCTTEELFVWGSLPASSSIACAIEDGESAPDSCTCGGCVAQRRRMVVASLAETLVGASLVKRHHVPGHVLFPRRCLIGHDVDPTSKAAQAELRREFDCLSVHRVVQEVVRIGHEPRQGLAPVVLAWQTSVTCAGGPGTIGMTHVAEEANHISLPLPSARRASGWSLVDAAGELMFGQARADVSIAGAEPPELRSAAGSWSTDSPEHTAATTCRSHWVPGVALKQIMAARHAAATAQHIRLCDATAVFALSTDDVLPPHVKLMCWVCQLAGLLCAYSELRAALALCEWVGTGERPRSGLWGKCMADPEAMTALVPLHCLRQLGSVYMRCNMFTDAATIFEMQLRVHGSNDHGAVAASLWDLSQVYRAQDRLNESVSLQKKCLAMYLRIHGSQDHSDVAASLWGLAAAFSSQCRLGEAASLYRESLAMRRRMYGSSDNRDVSTSLYGLAEVHSAQGRFDASASLHEESLAMSRRIHGSKDHSDVAVSLHSLAQVYLAQGRLGDSASLHEESLAMKRRIQDHSDVTASPSQTRNRCLQMLTECGGPPECTVADMRSQVRSAKRRRVSGLC